jgi:hypothetical protein
MSSILQVFVQLICKAEAKRYRFANGDPDDGRQSAEYL